MFDKQLCSQTIAHSHKSISYFTNIYTFIVWCRKCLFLTSQEDMLWSFHQINDLFGNHAKVINIEKTFYVRHFWLFTSGLSQV